MNSMSSIFLTSDLHFGSDRLSILQRPFVNTNEQYEFMLEKHNEVVKPDDLVLYLGDICDKGSKEFLPWLANFNGHKWLFRGNHDRLISDEEFAPYFNRIFPEKVVICTILFDIPISFNHYPSKMSAGYFHLTGHIHSSWKVQLNALNCGIDVHHFRPMNSDKIPFYLSAISNFYDEDVWIADSIANKTWRGTRGKPGYYNNEGASFIYMEPEELS